MNCCNHNDNFDNNTCKPVFHPTRHIFCLGPTGATGPTGPTGPSGGPTGPTARLVNSSNK